jgi:hypothetical protein
MKAFIFFALLMFAETSQAQMMGGAGPDRTGPSVIVYKTRHNYDKFVPVILSDDKKSIVSYPAPEDVFTGAKLAYPTKLAKGYLLDNRGINVHSAFLDITYEKYAKMKTVDAISLMKHIKSSDPFVFFYVCGKRHSYENLVGDLKTKIKAGKLKECDCLMNSGVVQPQD